MERHCTRKKCRYCLIWIMLLLLQECRLVLLLNIEMMKQNRHFTKEPDHNLPTASWKQSADFLYVQRTIAQSLTSTAEHPRYEQKLLSYRDNVHTKAHSRQYSDETQNINTHKMTKTESKKKRFLGRKTTEHKEDHIGKAINDSDSQNFANDHLNKTRQYTKPTYMTSEYTNEITGNNNTGKFSVPKPDRNVLEKTKKQVKITNTVWDDKWHFLNKRTKRFVSKEEEIDNIVTRIREVGNKANTSAKNIEFLKDIVCKESTVQILDHFWKDNPVTYIFYITSAAVMAHICSCHDVMRKHVISLVDKDTGDDALDLLEHLPEVFSSFEKIKHTRNRRSFTEPRTFDPESPENAARKHLQRLLVKSISRTHEFSELLFSRNASDVSLSQEAVEDLENSILEFDILTWDKQTGINPGETGESENTIYTATEQIGTNTRSETVSNAGSKTVLGKKSRPRRNIQPKDNTVVILNENYPCRLLSACDESLCFLEYSEDKLTQQLWQWEDGRLKNLGMGFFLHEHLNEKGDIGQDIITDELEMIFDNNSLTLSNVNRSTGKCFVHAHGNPEQVALTTECEKDDRQKWSQILFSDAQNSILTIACLFLIRSIETCSTATPVELNGTFYITFVPLAASNETILEQLWQWSGTTIKHFSSQKYLSVGNYRQTREVAARLKLEERDGQFIQNWIFENSILRSMELEHNISLYISSENFMVGGKYTEQLELVKASSSEFESCDVEGTTFVITHAFRPCQVLCPVEKTADVGILFRVIFAMGTFIFGSLLGLLSIMCTTKEHAGRLSPVFGVLATTVSVILMEYTSLFIWTYYTVNFETFDPSDPFRCLWQESYGKIKSFMHDKVFQIEPDIHDSMWQIRLQDTSLQAWRIINGSLVSTNGISCESQSVDDRSNFYLRCESQLESSHTWKTLSYDKTYEEASLEFVQEIMCVYTLRKTTDDSCRLLSSNGSYTVEVAPDNFNHDFVFSTLNALWISKDNTLTNLVTGVSLSSSDEYEQVRINFSQLLSSVCFETMFFIQSLDSPCKLLTAVNDGKVVKLSVAEYNPNTYLNQVWSENGEDLYNIGLNKKVSKVDIFGKMYNNSLGSVSEYCKLMNDTLTCGKEIVFTVNNSSWMQSNLPYANETHYSKWRKVLFDSEFSFVNQILCLYLLQNQGPHCAFLTANATTGVVFLEYLAPDVIQSQLWLKTDDRLNNIHFDSGFTLGQSLSTRQVVISELPDNYISLNFTYGKLLASNSNKLLSGFAAVDLVSEKDILLNGSQFWRFISLNELTLKSITSQCEKKNNFFFLKNENIPCKLLTVYKDELTFKVFDEALIERQLWYIENGRLFNVYSETVVKVAINLMKNYPITLGEMMVLDKTQVIFKKDNQILHVFNDSSVCYVTYDDINNSLNCRSSISTGSRWTFMAYEEDVVNPMDLYCLFGIQNKQAPCDFITGYTQSEHVHVRPVVEELVTNQVFFWNDDFIIHHRSGLLLTATLQQGSTLSLEKLHHDKNYIQRWKILDDQIVATSHYYVALELNIKNDGTINLAKSFCRNATDNTQKWQMVTWIGMTTTSSVKSCTTNNTKITDPFIIRSKENKCLVLNGGSLGQSPSFEALDFHETDRFLWYKDGNHIIHMNSSLALMMDVQAEGDDRQDVIMWHKYTFARAQQWSTEADQWSSFHNRKCFLHADTGNTDLFGTICNKNFASNVEIIGFNDQENFLQKTCSFFVKSKAEHCELLSHVGNGDVKTRPFLPEAIDSQLWFWRGNRIINFGVNKALTMSETEERSLKLDEESSSKLQSWSYSNLMFSHVPITGKSPSSISVYITINKESGNILASPLSEPVKLQQWVGVNFSEGTSRPEILSCPPSYKYNPLYVIRSDHGNCPVLISNKDNEITVVEYSESTSSHALWLKDGNYIVHVADTACLTLKESNVRGNKVFLRQKYAYDDLQSWSCGNNAIYSKVAKHSQYLTYTGQQISMRNKQSGDQQVWKWYTLEQLQSDPNLLRCSWCYNKAEEKAAEVISYIPVIGWLYNIGRSITYGVKNCPKVALSSLVEGLVDVALDVIVALSAGTASAFAYGVKVGLKFGAKAGIKAAFTAVKSMIKVSLLSITRKISTFVRHGVKNSFRLKMGSLYLKAKLAKSLLQINVARARNIIVRKFTAKNKQNVMRLIPTTIKGAYDKLKRTVSRIFKVAAKGSALNIKRLPYAIKQKASKKATDLNNFLSKKAEKAVQTLEHRKLFRCRRGDVCEDILFDIKDLTRSIPEVSDELRKILDDIKRPDQPNIVGAVQPPPEEVKGQVSFIGLKQDDKIIYKDKSHINSLRENAEKPEYRLGVTPVPSDYDVKHTEQDVLEKVDFHVRQNCEQSKPPCKVILYTKLSPCENRKPVEAKTCIELIIEKCKDWHQLTTTCIVTFEKPFYEDIFDKTWNEDIAELLGKPNKDVSRFSDLKHHSEKFMKDVLSVIRRRCDGHKILGKIADFCNSFRSASTPDIPVNEVWGKTFDNLKIHETPLAVIQKHFTTFIRESANEVAKSRKVNQILLKTMQDNPFVEFYQDIQI